MYFKSFIAVCAVTALLLLTTTGSRAAMPAGANAVQNPEVKVSAGEANALKKIEAAKDPTAKLAAAAEFLKKYAKSEMRRQVGEHVAAEIGMVTDLGQRMTLIEKFVAMFTEPGESDLIMETLLDAYIVLPQAADAFRSGATWLEKKPDNLDLMRRLAILATNESIKGNNTFLKQGYEYGLKAIAQIEADRRPADIEATKWATYKTTNLVALHREVGVLAMRIGDTAAAKSHLEKAASLKSTDPAVYLMLSDITNNDYIQQAQKQRGMPPGSAKDAELTRLTGALDRLIELFAQTLAMSERDPRYGEAAKAIRGDLETYYKFRHNGSTDGMQALIDKYKQP